MTSDAKLGLVAGVLAVVGVAVFGMPKQDPDKAVPSAAVPQQIDPTPPPPAAVKSTLE